jgi:phosphatidylglycerol:prolipoprotein diacylglycerol transferase
VEALAALFRFNVWSVAVPAAIVSSYWVALRRARQAGIPERPFESACQWAIGVGLVVSHAVQVIFYHPERLRREGFVSLLKFWDGLSSYGGFVGGLGAVLVIYALRRRSWWAEADAILQGWCVGWIFGRLGCTIAGDHPGGRTDFFLAYRYADGPRHNLGLYEMLFTLLLLLPANLLLHRKRPPAGSFVALNFLLYGAGRFVLDLFRAKDRPDSDPRYLGLTLAHYASIAVLGVGVWALLHARRGAAWPPDPGSLDSGGGRR